MYSARSATFLSNLRVASKHLRSKHTVSAGLVMVRDPIVTRTPSEFETEYNKYIDFLHYNTSVPFARDFYFKKGSISEKNWMKLDSERSSEWLFDPTNSTAKSGSGKAAKSSAGKQANEEDSVAAQQEQEEAEEEEGAVEQVNLEARITDADKKNDVRSLERKLDQSLYFLVKYKQTAGVAQAGEWVFPHSALGQDEVLFKGAVRTINEVCGNNIDSWVVGRGPIGHYIHNSSADTAAKNKTFFLKAHILAGSIESASADKLVDDYTWATKDEIEKLVKPEYWQGVSSMI
ncbi:54S ribosomal protein L17, mitochondrial [Smittium culicis]|uniref:Large ribosomal subunit protein mL46 n=1 Tax=Smittium culicis TaxID=133412 RepID=A0A1R1YN97_9FUNG|nr:54S ribosomal protein L17, mitochondrial [Smittium culicis]